MDQERLDELIPLPRRHNTYYIQETPMDEPKYLDSEFTREEIYRTVGYLRSANIHSQADLARLDKGSGFINAGGIGKKRRHIVEWLRSLSPTEFEAAWAIRKARVPKPKV